MSGLDTTTARQLAAAATPPPWVQDKNSWLPNHVQGVYNEWKGRPNALVAQVYGPGENIDNAAARLANAKFIAWARAGVPALCDEIDQLRAENAVLVGALVVERNTSRALGGLAEANRRAAITAEALTVLPSTP